MVPSVEVKPSSAMMRRNAGSKRRNMLSSARRSSGARGVARTAQTGSNGLRTALTPAARAARSSKHVRVLVRIDVRWTQAAALEQADLRGGFGFDLGFVDLSCKKPTQERAQLPGKAARVRIYQRRNFARRQHRLSVHQNHVAAHAERGRGKR